MSCKIESPGSMNDSNVPETSLLRQEILRGDLLPGFKYSVNGREQYSFYFLVNGIYPLWAIIVSTISEKLTKKERRFSVTQEALRNDIERAFGVLISRWALL